GLGPSVTVELAQHLVALLHLVEHVLGGDHALIGGEEHTPAVGEANGGVTLAAATRLIRFVLLLFRAACLTAKRVAMHGLTAALGVLSDAALQTVAHLQRHFYAIAVA